MITFNYRKAKLIMSKAEVVSAFELFGYNPYYLDTETETDKFEDTEYSILYFEFMYSVVDIIINDIDTINNNDATTLSTSNEYVVLRIKDLIISLMPDIISYPDKVSYLVVQIIYAYKYVTVRTFFQDNYKKFLPEFFLDELESAEKRTLLLKSFMQEFDKLAEMIEYASSNYDISEAQNEFMYYLGEMIGNVRDEYLTDEGFREFSKYIIEIYRRKGSLYSFELYFNLLGFSIELTEFWFDKRFANPNFEPEEDRRFTDKSKFTYYLTNQRPTEFIPQGLADTDYVLEEDFVAPQNLMYFDFIYNSLQQSQKYKLFLPINESLLPDDPNYGYGFIYFKTNYVTYEITKERTSIYTAEDISNGQMLKKYIDFLTPIFVKHDIIFNFKPFDDVWKFLMLDTGTSEKRVYDFGLGKYQESSENGDLISTFKEGTSLLAGLSAKTIKEAFLVRYKEIGNLIANKSITEAFRIELDEVFIKTMKKTTIEKGYLNINDSLNGVVKNISSEYLFLYFKEEVIKNQILKNFKESARINLLEKTLKNKTKDQIEVMGLDVSDFIVFPMNKKSLVVDVFSASVDVFGELETFEEWLNDENGFTYYAGEDNSMIVKDIFSFKVNPIKSPPFVYI